MVDWSKAPAWANYAAMDKDGEWYWYENEPTPAAGLWVADPGSEFDRVYDIDHPDWRTTLTTRPDAQPPTR